MDNGERASLDAVDLGFGRFDTSAEGNSNQGHTYGAHLDEAEAKALLEYLKTL